MSSLLAVVSVCPLLLLLLLLLCCDCGRIVSSVAIAASLLTLVVLLSVAQLYSAAALLLSLLLLLLLLLLRTIAAAAAAAVGVGTGDCDLLRASSCFSSSAKRCASDIQPCTCLCMITNLSFLSNGCTCSVYPHACMYIDIVKHKDLQLSSLLLRNMTHIYMLLSMHGVVHGGTYGDFKSILLVHV
jgi:hypothetical protein